MEALDRGGLGPSGLWKLCAVEALDCERIRSCKPWTVEAMECESSGPWSQWIAALPSLSNGPLLLWHMKLNFVQLFEAAPEADVRGRLVSAMIECLIKSFKPAFSQQWLLASMAHKAQLR